MKNTQEIEDIQLIKTNEDYTKTYQMTIKEDFKDSDLRKKIASLCAENNVLVMELKKEEQSLEDAFMKLIENRPEYSIKEIKKMQYEKDLKELREEIEEKKAAKEMKKELKLKSKEEKRENKKGENE